MELIKRRGALVVVSAPSGAGKTTLCHEVRRLVPDLFYSVSHTTRLPRAGEVNGTDFHFVSEAEFLDMETDPLIDLMQVTKSLNSALPEGVRVLEARIVPKKAGSLSGSIGRYIYEVGVPVDLATSAEGRTREFLAREAVILEKDGKQKDIRPGIETIAIKGPAFLEVVIQDSEETKPRIQDIIEKLFAIGHDRAVMFNIKRTAMYMKVDGSWQSPMDV